MFDVQERVIITHSPGSVTALRTIDQSSVRRIGKFDLSIDNVDLYSASSEKNL